MCPDKGKIKGEDFIDSEVTAKVLHPLRIIANTVVVLPEKVASLLYW